MQVTTPSKSMANFPVKYITDQDVKQASQNYPTAKFGPIGNIVDVRTYRRWLPELQRREQLYERNQRVVNYNCNLTLDKDPNIEADAKLMFDMMNQFLAFPSGRSMWVGGTRVSDLHPAGNFNCSALAINRVGAFLSLFELLMLGTGVGYRVFSSDIEQLPEIQNIPAIEFEEYFPVHPTERVESTKAEFNPSDGYLYVTVGDSRQGWIDALGCLLDVVFNRKQYGGYVENIIFCVDSIRPMGEKINGFGGTASGPDALVGIIADVHRVIDECPTSKLRSIDCMDICDATAKGVVAGSSRRSALICLFEEGDDLCAAAKFGLYTDPGLAHKKYRIQSNNTECLGVKYLPEFRLFLESNPDADWFEIKDFISQRRPSAEWLKKRFETVKAEGEPGFNNYLMMVAKRWKAVRQWRPDCPVHEIWQRYCNICTNPCFTGDMELLTTKGYRKFSELVGTEFEVINAEGRPTPSKVWASGRKPTVVIKNSLGEILKSTPDHVWLTDKGECQAKDLKGRRLKPFTSQDVEWPLVTSVTEGEEELVYDFTEPEIHWGVVNGYIAHNCHEIILSAGYHPDIDKCGYGVSFCNLTTIPLQNFVIDSQLDEALLETAVRLTTRIGLRQTCVTMPRDELHHTQIEERLLGVSATGWRMLFDLLGWSTADNNVKDLQSKMNFWANDEATKYAKVLGVPRPLLVTCIKPEGTGSKVFGSTDGLHWDWAPYYIRRVQMSTTDALARTLKKQGFIWNPKDYDLDKLIKPYKAEVIDKNGVQLEPAQNMEVTTWDRIEEFKSFNNEQKDYIFEKSNAVTFDFPIKSPAKVAGGSVSAIEQLENMKSFTVWYTDHMPSSTITVKEGEWDGCAEWIYENWADYITASLFSYWNGSMPLLPYETITKEKYEELLSQFDEKYVAYINGRATFLVDESVMAQEEREDLNEGVDIDDIDLTPDCSSGACPIR